MKIEEGKATFDFLGLRLEIEEALERDYNKATWVLLILQDSMTRG